MSIREIGGAPAALAPTTVEEMVGFSAIESGDEAAQASTELRALGRDLRSQAQRQQVAEQRRAAEQELIAGVARGLGQIVSGGLAIAGGAHGLGSAGQPPSGTEQAQEQFRTRIDREVSLFNNGGALARAGADIGAAVATRDAAESRVRATEHEHAASLAQEVIQQAAADAEEARSTETRATDALVRILDENRRTTEAATRA
jgi:hypothetical protein